MEPFVDVVQTAVVDRRDATGSGEFLIQGTQLLDEQPTIGDVERGGASRTQPFQGANDVEQLVDVVTGQRRHGETRLLRARCADHEAFLLETLQRFANRRPTHAKA